MGLFNLSKMMKNEKDVKVAIFVSIISTLLLIASLCSFYFFEHEHKETMNWVGFVSFFTLGASIRLVGRSNQKH